MGQYQFEKTEGYKNRHQQKLDNIYREKNILKNEWRFGDLGQNEKVKLDS